MGSSCMKSGSDKNKIKPTSRNKSIPVVNQTSELVLVESSGFIGKRKGSVSDHYEFLAKLGAGAFGSVHLAVNKTTNQKRAIKTIKKILISDDMKEKSQFFNEVDILKQTDHPNIVRLYEFFEDEHNYHLVLEYVSGGELFDYIVKSKHLSEAIASRFMKQVLSAVAYCHKKNIVHRDLKPENLLLDKEGSNATLKVVDFGTSAIIETSKKMRHKYGTAYYIAPEVLSRDYNEKCDIWSCGVILYILLSGKPPFNGKNDADILRSVLAGHFSIQGAEWAKVSPYAKTLVCRMLQLNPKERITAEQALNDPWIVGLSNYDNVSLDVAALNNLHSFHAELKLQHAIISFIAFQMVSKEEAKRLADTFSKIDKNKDGKLSHEELLEAYMLQMGKETAVEEVRKIMEQVDTNNSGFIDYTEFITACSAKQELLSKENIDSAFRVLDADSSGKITASELKEYLFSDNNIKKEIWDSMIREVDQNGDGEIDIEEFKNMMITYLKREKME